MSCKKIFFKNVYQTKVHITKRNYFHLTVQERSSLQYLQYTEGLWSPFDPLIRSFTDSQGYKHGPVRNPCKPTDTCGNGNQSSQLTPTRVFAASSALRSRTVKVCVSRFTIVKINNRGSGVRAAGVKQMPPSARCRGRESGLKLE